MSYDLETASHDKPGDDLVVEFARERDLIVDGSLDDEQAIRVARRTRRGTSAGFTLDGPFRVDFDDLPDALLGAVLAPRWLMQFSAPDAASAADRALARGLAIHLAEACAGAAYDPQMDRLIFPRGKRRRFRAPAVEERISVLNVSLVLPPLRHVSVARALLEQLSSVREARPVRFGTFEPLQQRLPEDDDRGFGEQWAEQLVAPWGDNFFWTATAPFFGGSVYFPDWREDEASDEIERVTVITLDIDGRALVDNAWRSALIELFARAADRLDAVYGAAYIEHGWLARRGRLWADGRTQGTDAFNVPRGVWLGLPPEPCWLSWFGPVYRARLEAELTAEPIGSGLLLRVGGDPLQSRTLDRDFPPLPETLVWRWRTEAEMEREFERLEPFDRTLLRLTLEREPAVWLPRLRPTDEP